MANVLGRYEVGSGRSRAGISLEYGSCPEKFKFLTIFLEGLLSLFHGFQILSGKFTEGNPKCTSGTYMTLDGETKTFEVNPQTLFGIQMYYRPTVK